MLPGNFVNPEKQQFAQAKLTKQQFELKKGYRNVFFLLYVLLDIYNGKTDETGRVMKKNDILSVI